MEADFTAFQIFTWGILLVIILGIYKICKKIIPNFYPNIIATFIWISLLMLYPTIGKSEIIYDHKNPEHIADKKCLAIFSIMRDSTKLIGDNATYNEVTEWQNKMFLKYEYSKKLNTHVDVYKMLLTQKFNDGSWVPNMTETIDCVERI